MFRQFMGAWDSMQSGGKHLWQWCVTNIACSFNIFYINLHILAFTVDNCQQLLLSRTTTNENLWSSMLLLGISAFFHEGHRKLLASPCWKWQFFWLLFKHSVQGGDVFRLLLAIFRRDFIFYEDLAKHCPQPPFWYLGNLAKRFITFF